MLDHALLAIGALMIAAGVTLAFKERSTAALISITLLGVICCLTQAPNLERFVFKSGGVETTVDMREVKAGATDLQAQLASSDQMIKSLSTAFARQVEFNAAVDARLRSLEGAIPHADGAQGAMPQPNVTAANPQVEKNNGTSVLVFYRDPRAADAAAIKKALIDAGFQSASINSSLSETTVGPQEAGTTYITYSMRGKPFVEPVEALIKPRLGSPGGAIVAESGPISLRRGDLQVYLF